jgi:hypothetical protein
LEIDVTTINHDLKEGNMARFKDFDLPGTSGKVWELIKKKLDRNQSVEVMVDDNDKDRVFIRVWDDVRNDGSNNIEADPDTNY